MLKLAVMGGTFNPPHIAHLICAEQVYEHFNLDKVLFIPTARPPHKDSTFIIDAHHRYRMTELAIKDNPHFDISRIEIDRSGTSYTIETVKELRKIYGSETLLYWIVGADLILDMLSWKSIDELIELCQFIGINRPGYDISKADPKIIKGIHMINVTNIDISSSEIRERVRKGRSIKYLVPSAVEEYIYQNRLYVDDKGS